MNALALEPPPQATSSRGPIEMCSVRAGEMRMGLPIGHILEIIAAVRPYPVPLAPEFVGGLVHYRGDVLTTVSLRYLLGLAPLERPQPILVLEGVGGCYGVLVDAVGEVLTLSPDAFEPNPSTLDPVRKQFFSGAYKLRNQLMVVLNLARLDPSLLAEEV